MIELPIDTARTQMRPVRSEDLDAVHAIIGDRATTADVSWGQPDKESTNGWIRRRIADQQEHGYSMWAVALLGGGEIVGLCGFFSHEGDRIELGYVIRADSWGQGLAPEAVSAAVDAAIEAGYAVFATVRNTNTRSVAVARRIGLTQDGTITDERGTLLVFTHSSPQHDPIRS